MTSLPVATRVLVTVAVAVAGVLLGLVGCLSARNPFDPGPGAPPPPWESGFGREHPLVGRIWDVAGAHFIDPSTLGSRVALARFALLGERHDNPDHHRLQAWVLRAIVDAGRRPAVGFEMLTADQAAALARYLSTDRHDAAGLGEAVGWKQSGWPAWSMYQPIAEVALAAGLRIVTTDVAKATMEAMRKNGIAGMDAALVTRYGLDHPPSKDDEASMAAEIREAHCNQAPEAMIPKMIVMQRVRDAHMADSLLAAATPDGAVLVSGTGHARTDWAVPAYLRMREPTASIASVAFLEVSDDRRVPADYAESFHATRLPFDYVWFTPRVDDEDPCEKFKPSLERLRKKG